MVLPDIIVSVEIIPQTSANKLDEQALHEKYKSYSRRKSRVLISGLLSINHRFDELDGDRAAGDEHADCICSNIEE